MYHFLSSCLEERMNSCVPCGCSTLFFLWVRVCQESCFVFPAIVPSSVFSVNLNWHFIMRLRWLSILHEECRNVPIQIKNRRRVNIERRNLKKTFKWNQGMKESSCEWYLNACHKKGRKIISLFVVIEEDMKRRVDRTGNYDSLQAWQSLESNDERGKTSKEE
jgi:hypothetical protein